MPGEPEAGQEGAGLGEAAAKAGEVGETFDGLGRGADGAFGRGLPDERGMGGEVARGAALGFAAFKAVESAVAVGEDVALRGGNADVGEASRVFPGVPEVDGPEDVRRAADDRIGMAVAVGEDGGSAESVGRNQVVVRDSGAGKGRDLRSPREPEQSINRPTRKDQPGPGKV